MMMEKRCDYPDWWILFEFRLRVEHSHMFALIIRTFIMRSRCHIRSINVLFAHWSLKNRHSREWIFQIPTQTMSKVVEMTKPTDGPDSKTYFMLKSTEKNGQIGSQCQMLSSEMFKNPKRNFSVLRLKL